MVCWISRKEHTFYLLPQQQTSLWLNVTPIFFSRYIPVKRSLTKKIKQKKRGSLSPFSQFWKLSPRDVCNIASFLWHRWFLLYSIYIRLSTTPKRSPTSSETGNISRPFFVSKYSIMTRVKTYVVIHRYSVNFILWKITNNCSVNDLDFTLTRAQYPYEHI